MEPGGIWAELRRRGVVRVAVGYGAAVFVALQLADLVFPALGAPDWAMELTIVLSVVGFPVALVLGWVFDVTPSGIRRTERVGPRSGPPQPTWAPLLRYGTLTGALVVLASTAWWFVQSRSNSAPALEEGDRSIAVLPFADLSPERDQGYLGDGLAEELLNQLTRISGLRVAARTSSFAFRNAETDIREIGRRLNVANVLEGSVRKDGDRIRVTAQLIDVGTGFHRWSDNFDHAFTSVLEIQDTISKAIADALQVTLAIDAVAPAGERGAPSGEAYVAYLRGRQSWNKRTGGALALAVAQFQAAVDEAPGFAKAHAGLADSYALLPLFAPGIEAEHSWAKAEAEAREAIRLDPSLAEAHASLGLVLGFRYRLDEAIAELAQATRLNPGYATGRHWYSQMLSEQGRHADAVVEARAAVRLDTLSLPINQDLGYALLWAGGAAQAVLQFEHTTKMDSTFAGAWLGLALARYWQGSADDGRPALDALSRWAELSHLDGAPFLAALEAAFALRDGAPASAATRSTLAMALADTRLAGLTAAVNLQGLLGDREATLAGLLRSIETRGYVSLYPSVNPAFDFLRADPEFQDFMGQLRSAASGQATDSADP